MRLSRMTTRRWMLVVAVVSLVCLLEHRRRSFESLAAYHESKTALVFSMILSTEDHLYRERVCEWHASLAPKYRYAAHYPWLPVEPDPPEPE
jgi:hypothetical protein